MSASIGQRLWPSLAAIFLLWLAIFVPGLPQPSLFDDADGAHAEAGREMLTLHDWVTLHENGIRYLEKAPLPYWAMAVSFRLFGVSESSARLAQGLGVLLLAFLLVQMGRRFLSAEAGLWAGSRLRHLVRALPFYPHPDSRFARRLVDRAGPLFFPARLARAAAVAVVLLGARGHRCAQRAHQRLDRPGFSLRDHFCVFVAGRRPPPSPEDAA